MSVSIPSVLQQRLSAMIYGYTHAGESEAWGFASLIVDIITRAANDALSYSRVYTETTEQIIYNNLDDDLDTLMAYTDRQVDIVKDGLGDAILLLQSQLDNLGGGIGGEIGDKIVNAYNSIADSHRTVGDVVQLAIEKAADAATESQEKVGGWLQEQFSGALAVVNSTIDHIREIPKMLVEFAVDTLIPAETQAWFNRINEVLKGEALRKTLELGGEVFQKRFAAALSIDEDELQKWIKKGSEYMQSIAIEAAKPEGAI